MRGLWVIVGSCFILGGSILVGLGSCNTGEDLQSLLGLIAVAGGSVITWEHWL